MALKSRCYIALFIFLQSVSAMASTRDCEENLMGPRFLHSKYPKLFRTQAIEVAANKAQAKGEPMSQPEHRILAWLSGLERFKFKKRDNTLAVGQIKKWFHRRYVTQASEISESYFQIQVRVPRELGIGNIPLTKELRDYLASSAITDQIESLDPWIDYLLSADTDAYPAWLKYWALMGVVRLAKFDPGSGTFNERSRGQAQPFPELNREAFALLVDWMVKKVHGQSLSAIQENPSFAKLYAKALDFTTSQQRDLSVTKGRWVRFPQKSDPRRLVDSLMGMTTGWCTVGISTAQSQLDDGDFYVYFSEDFSGTPRIPRIAIRMKGSTIGEIRGIAQNQTLDTVIANSPILDTKLKDFGVEAEKYTKRSSDMKTLTEIEHKVRDKIALNIEELRFLYEMENKIEGFGPTRDPRIEEIQNARNIKADLALILEISDKQVSLTPEEAIQPWVIYHHGDLNLSHIRSAQGLSLPVYVGGSINLSGLTSAEDLRLPEYVEGSIDLSRLKNAKRVTFPHRMGGHLNLSQLEVVQEVTLPRYVQGSLNLNSLVSALGINLPQYVGGDVLLQNISSAFGIILPRYIGGDLLLGGLTSRKGLVPPQHLGGIYIGPR